MTLSVNMHSWFCIKQCIGKYQNSEWSEVLRICFKDSYKIFKFSIKNIEQLKEKVNEKSS
jgi:hypothetical protein